MQRLSGGDALERFFLAMAHWQLGKKDEARQWYDKAVKRMNKNEPGNEDIRRFRIEAAELLGIPAVAPKPKTKEKETADQRG